MAVDVQLSLGTAGPYSTLLLLGEERCYTAVHTCASASPLADEGREEAWEDRAVGKTEPFSLGPSFI